MRHKAKVLYNTSAFLIACLALGAPASASVVKLGFEFASEQDNAGELVQGYVMGSWQSGPFFGAPVVGASYFLPTGACITQSPIDIGPMCLSAASHQFMPVGMIDGKFIEDSWFDGGIVNLSLGPSTSSYNFVYTFNNTGPNGEPLKDQYRWTTSQAVSLFDLAAPAVSSASVVPTNLVSTPLPTSALVLLSAFGALCTWGRVKSRKRVATPA